MNQKYHQLNTSMNVLVLNIYTLLHYVVETWRMKIERGVQGQLSKI